MLKRDPVKLPQTEAGVDNDVTAAQAVLGTPELVDLILAYLSPATLLRSCVKVCRVWWYVISNPSLSLQVALFLRPAEGGELVFNDILPKWRVERPVVNHWHFPFENALIPVPIDELGWRKNEEAWERSEERWSGMLISQPPCRDIIVVTTFSVNWELRPPLLQYLKMEKGLTIGLLRKKVEDWNRKKRTLLDSQGRVTHEENSVMERKVFSIGDMERASGRLQPRFGPYFLKIVTETMSENADDVDVFHGPDFKKRRKIMKKKKAILGRMKERISRALGAVLRRARG
ncbi:uncharacterized protein LY89DRAFT_734977 [Mollisia scopiformis]|uniref:F-box domain-containing protein n=1 Tax=Mollisia scopiformis TaxID=149040 RepID=A0A194X6W8_MOLSC|nr:uncharacterized protein LY89DRAFT_734977 [Mollisia scopiformis]KUJ15829.1 hypothetical protein LY89DRAFT_734977 [Mollisia scopiformis]